LPGAQLNELTNSFFKGDPLFPLLYFTSRKKLYPLNNYAQTECPPNRIDALVEKEYHAVELQPGNRHAQMVEQELDFKEGRFWQNEGTSSQFSAP